MITTGIINIVWLFLSIVLTPLKNVADVVLDSHFSTAITNAGGYYHSLNAVLPVDTMLQILGVSLVMEGAYLTYKIIMWVIQKIPMLN